MLDLASVVAIFDNSTQSECAVRRLRQAGFDMSRFSIIGRARHIGDWVHTENNLGARILPGEGEFMLVLDGTTDEVDRAKAVLSSPSVVGAQLDPGGTNIAALA